jgi:hypothetical protein
VALQAPAMRLDAHGALQWLPALQRAALAFSRIDAPAGKITATTAKAARAAQR